MRWGGCFSSYYRWKEAVGPRRQRVPMHNLLWGGMEDNQVGTVEFVDFCRQVGAEPLMCVNFESDGRKAWMQSPLGSVRSAGPEEAAEWVEYCNNPKKPSASGRTASQIPARSPSGRSATKPPTTRTVSTWRRPPCKTVQFAQAMRKADPTIKLIGWGDSGWARRMIEVAGEHLAVHRLPSHVQSRRHRSRSSATTSTARTRPRRGRNSWTPGSPTRRKSRACANRSRGAASRWR